MHCFFSHSNTLGIKFDLVNRSRSTQGHHLYNFYRQVPFAFFQVSRSSDLRFWRRRFLNTFTVYGIASHFCLVMWSRTNYLNVCSREAYMFYKISDSNWPCGFWKDVWNFDGHSILVILSHVQWMTLTFDVYKGSYKIYFHFNYYNLFG